MLIPPPVDSEQRDLGPMYFDLDATATSRFWSERPGGWDRVNLRRVFPSSNLWGIPDLAPTAARPDKLVKYTNTPYPSDATIHFFLDDYRFESVWSRPEQMLARIQSTGLACSPDFSVWTRAPHTVQLWNVYRSRWCGAYWQSEGVDVIPTVTWGGPDTYDFCFAGLAGARTVALSTVGCVRSKDARSGFVAGFEAMIDAVQPETIVCYGTVLPEIKAANVLRFSSRWADSARSGGSEVGGF